jgi:hypothetical protein
MCMARGGEEGALSVMESLKGRRACTGTRERFYWRLEDTVSEALDQRKKKSPLTSSYISNLISDFK